METDTNIPEVLQPGNGTQQVIFSFSVSQSERAQQSLAKLIAIFLNQRLTGLVSSADKEESSLPDNSKNVLIT